MAEGPVEPTGADGAAVRTPDEGQTGESGRVPSRAVPKPVIKADLLPGLSVISTVALLGLPLGWLWSRLAPPKERMLAANGQPVPFLAEEYQRFDALAIFLLLSLAIGALTGAALWMFRGRRGPVILIAGVLGSLACGWVGMQTGVAFTGGLYPSPAAPRPGDIVELAPDMANAWSLVVQPFALALVYGLAASWNGLDDLGRRR